MTETKQSAIEAAAKASYEQGDQYYGAWQSLDASLREYAIKNAGGLVAAYLSAIAEDEAILLDRKWLIKAVHDDFGYATSSDQKYDKFSKHVQHEFLRTLLERLMEQQG
jgi:hypothetical protein